jgi:hypothetical protein
MERETSLRRSLPRLSRIRRVPPATPSNSERLRAIQTIWLLREPLLAAPRPHLGTRNGTSDTAGAIRPWGAEPIGLQRLCEGRRWLDRSVAQKWNPKRNFLCLSNACELRVPAVSPLKQRTAQRKTPRYAGLSLSSGGGIRTRDLRVMSFRTQMLLRPIRPQNG